MMTESLTISGIAAWFAMACQRCVANGSGSSQGGWPGMAGRFNQLEQNAPRGSRMDEGDPPPPGPDPRRWLDDFDPFAAQGRQCLVDPVDPDTDVMDTLAPLGQEFRHGCVGSHRLEQL